MRPKIHIDAIRCADIRQYAALIEKDDPSLSILIKKNYVQMVSILLKPSAEVFSAPFLGHVEIAYGVRTPPI